MATSDAANSAVPQSTRDAYARAWRRWEAWCAEHGRVALPATPETLAEFVGSLERDGAGIPTIEQSIAAIRTVHRHAGYRGHPDSEGAALLLRGARRKAAENGRRVRRALPITVDTLRVMIAACPPGLEGLRDRVTLITGIALMGRRSELAALRLSEVAEDDNGLLIYIRSSKTDQDAVGVEIAVPHGQRADLDLVRLIREWRAALAERGVHDGPLLRGVRYGRLLRGGLSGQAINDLVRRAAVRANLTRPDEYTAHSLRAGGATAAWQAGATVSAITGHGRWTEGSAVVLSYIRAVDRWKDNPMTGVL